jgi:hypothetical protein
MNIIGMILVSQVFSPTNRSLFHRNPISAGWVLIKYLIHSEFIALRGIMGTLGCHFPTRRGGFCTPGTSDAFTASTDTVPIPSTGTAQKVGPLTSSPPSRSQSLGGAL